MLRNTSLFKIKKEGEDPTASTSGEGDVMLP